MATPLRLLQQSILDGGIASVNFFNGRLLTAEDLQREQAARRSAYRRLAQAIGDGVAWGLEVQAATDQAELPVVNIAPGMAINRKGQTLQLAQQVQLVLSDRQVPNAAVARTFDDCGLRKGTYATKNDGIYLLTVAPAEGDRGRAPVHALNAESVRCNADTVVEGLQFRLLNLSPELSAAARQDKHLMRNTVAWQCFDLAAFDSFLIDPLRMPASGPGPLQALTNDAITDCDVPLAVVRVERAITFVDLWSVRRRPTPRSAAPAWSRVIDSQRQAEGEAMFLQFQDQVAMLAAPKGHIGGVVVGEKFDLLPAAGVLPVPAGKSAELEALSTFFGNVATRGPAYIEGARLEGLLRDSFAYPPMDPRKRELVWLYRVRENRQALDEGIAPAPQGFVVFASGHMPYLADARMDVAKWNYSNLPIDA